MGRRRQIAGIDAHVGVITDHFGLFCFVAHLRKWFLPVDISSSRRDANLR
jgi:UPF0716 family protein affecting phage T7 exclusion